MTCNIFVQCLVAHVCNLKPGDFVHTLGDAHVYRSVSHLHLVLTAHESAEHLPKRFKTNFAVLASHIIVTYRWPPLVPFAFGGAVTRVLVEDVLCKHDVIICLAAITWRL
jgi:hypothetical protein